jgi:hypothetical protein
MKSNTVTTATAAAGIRLFAVAIAIFAVLVPASSASGDVVLRRDGAQAEPFAATVANPVPAHGYALRRDGSRAEPFRMSGEPQALAAGDGFDWSDAAIGAGVGALTALLGLGGVAALGGRGPRTA